jgi:hypothetical protein
MNAKPLLYPFPESARARVALYLNDSVADLLKKIQDGAEVDLRKHGGRGDAVLMQGYAYGAEFGVLTQADCAFTDFHWCLLGM